MGEQTRRETIRGLNDNFRTTFQGGRVMMTAGIQALGEVMVAKILQAVREFSGFSHDNDPHGEHDFGSLDIVGRKVFWKIDYYDPAMEFGSEHPEDPTQTTRVLTIMLASES